MPTVAFQGVRGAYSESAIYQFFGPEAKPYSCKSLEKIFEAVDKWMEAFEVFKELNDTNKSLTIYRGLDVLGVLCGSAVSGFSFRASGFPDA